VKSQAKKTTNLVVGAMVAIAVLATGFWIVALSPKRDEAAKLSARVEKLESDLAQHQAEADAAIAARKGFSKAYQQLVVLGKAVPGNDETASLLVQINQIAAAARVSFQTLKLNATGEEAGEATVAAAPGAQQISATEASAALLPLGAEIGAAGLGVMPYTLTLEGDFFRMADFIRGLDEMVKTTNENVAVDGRLVTIDGFVLEPAQGAGFPQLQATFAVTTYLTPPTQGVAAGATSSGPESGTTLTSTTTGEAP
jgi:hypothetical protein